MPTKICLILTENTLEKNVQLIQQYREWIDIAELRADFLLPEELLSIRTFPERAGIPVILTIRRAVDGGFFTGGEGSRITLFARGLAFADTDSSKNFAYIDLESDVYAPSLEEAAKAFNIRIIRSWHDCKQHAEDIPALIQNIRRSEYDIVKIAYHAENLDAVTRLFAAARVCRNDHIFVAMGRYGMPSRLLAWRLHSEIVYTLPAEYIQKHNLESEHIDPVTLNTRYRFRSGNDETLIYGVIGADTSKSLSPAIHNQGFIRKGINAVYVPVSGKKMEEIAAFAQAVPMSGFSVTYPFKFAVRPFLHEEDKSVQDCAAVNTVICKNGLRSGFNTDAGGLIRALQEFLGINDLRFKRVAVIGTGGAAHAAAYAVAMLHGKACIFGRSAEKAAALARRYRFKWKTLDAASTPHLKTYSYLIIQTTSAGMADNKDPLEFYKFSGSERVFDCIYVPEKTLLLKRAEKAGCKIMNGFPMLKYQAYGQFELFTGGSYE